MAHTKYGLLDRNKYRSVELPVAASQFFRHDGINLVYIDANGRVALALTATATLYGIAQVPTGTGAGTDSTYWKSSATAGADKIAVYPFALNLGMFMLLPSDDTVTIAMRGNACDIVAVNDGTATTVDVGTSSTDVLLIHGRGVDFKQDAIATDVVVSVNPAKVQADT
jgi:hypothetical protein